MFKDDKKESICPSGCRCRNREVKQTLDGVVVSKEAYYKLQSVLNEVCQFCRKENCK